MTPPPKHKKVDKDGYELTFYPGFLSRAVVQVDGKEDVLYRQEVPHKVKDESDEPDGSDEPLTRFELRLEGGPNDRDFTLHVDDPQHAIAEIVVKLYPRGHKPQAGEDPQPVEILSARNDAILCPPMC